MQSVNKDIITTLYASGQGHPSQSNWGEYRREPRYNENHFISQVAFIIFLRFGWVGYQYLAVKTAANTEAVSA
jgi:hypothetical protein